MIEALIAAHLESIRPPATQKGEAVTVSCFVQEAQRQRLPPGILLAVLKQENGRVGQVRRNTNNTVDMGPMQINSVWSQEIAKKLGVSVSSVEEALTFNGCFNVGIGAWILRERMDSAGEFWRGVGHYHSRTPERARSYIQSVYRHLVSMRLMPSTTTSYGTSP